MEFAYDGGGLSRGGGVTLYLDGNLIGKGRVEYKQPVPANSKVRSIR